ncbi:MAG: endonuclease [Planctomycetes bacterium]|jgi:endonuclease I|nr:endonuclease [Planctomycetota bacterium]
MRLSLAVLATATLDLVAQPPPTYYATVNTTSQALLRSTLHAVIDDHTRIPYTASGTDTWDVLELADQAPGSTTQILDLYKNALYAKQGGGNTFYNREHTWPNSYGFPVDGGTNYPYTDCHHLFLCDIAYNSARDNNPFQAAQASWTEWTTVSNAGQGGGSGTFPGNSNWWSSIAPAGGWQTWGSRKGDVARALFYMDVRYEGGNHGGTGAAEPDLRLTDDVNLIDASATGSNTTGIAYMGRLSTLVQWHNEDPVDAKEIARNNAVFLSQGNRNPFVDNPQWVACLFQNQCVRVRQAEVWINELHYDNTGVDQNEFVEIAGPAGQSVANWQLIAYDGTTGAAYLRQRLSGVIPNQQNGYGTLSFAMPGLQDGSPDGIALVTAGGQVMQFLSYEGTFTAVRGAAHNRASAAIGTSESGTTPVGTSLQLGGTAGSYLQFTWQNSLLATPGARNTGQTFQ